MNLGGASRGYLNFVQNDQARAQQALQMKQLEAQLQAYAASQQAQQSALGARQKWGGVLQGMMGGGQPEMGGVPPPPGTPAGGPIPPGVGVSSIPPGGPPMGPPGAPPGPPGAIPPPPGVPRETIAPGGTLPPPIGAYNGPPGAGTGPIPGASGPPMAGATALSPYKPMPTSPQVPPPPAEGVPPPPNPAGPGAGAPPGQQFGLPQILKGLQTAGIPPDQWGVMLDNLPEPVKNNAAQEIKLLHEQNATLKAWADSQFKAGREDRLRDQGDRKIDQGDRKLDQGADRNATQKALAEAKIKYMEAGGSAQFDATDKAYWSGVLKAGGTLPPGLSRDPAGRKFVQELMRDVSHGGQSPEEMLSNQAQFMGEKAGQRTLGTRTANIEMAAREAGSLAELAKQASNKVPRTEYKKLNDVIQAAQKAGSAPELRAFIASNTSLINAYARAINPQGVGTVADKEHARDMLDTAFSKGDYAATVDQLLLEIDAARKSPGAVKDEMRDRFTAKSPSGRNVAPQQAIDDLKAHPELAADFLAKYHYMPPGIRGQ